MNTLLRDVIAFNAVLLSEAHQLNIRAGKTVFTVATREEILRWVQDRIGGATSCATVSNPEALRLPRLDREKVDAVIRENPDSINILGRQLPVEYRQGYKPRVKIDLASIENRFWRELPDNGIFLPGGQAVEVLVQIGWYDSFSAGTDIPTLKVRVREYLNRKQWDNWTRPVVTQPDFTKADVVIPEVTTAPYGSCVVDGTPLLAYGVLVWNGYRYYETDPWFKMDWSRDKALAEAVRAKSVAKLDEVRGDLVRQAELAEARAQADAVQKQINASYNTCYWSAGLPKELSDKLRRFAIAYIPYNVQEVRQWISDANDAVAEVELFIVGKSLREERDVVARQLSPVGAVAVQTQPKVAEVSGKFTEVGSRWFKCPSGHTLRVDKSEMNRYQQGETISLYCSVCGSKGNIKR